MTRLNNSEGSLKKVVRDWLAIQRNQGKLLWFELNSGNFFVEGRMIRGCEKGTADFLILRWYEPQGAPNKGECQVIFVELKSQKGKQSKEQKEFELSCKKQGAQYHIVRSLEELETIWGEEK